MLGRNEYIRKWVVQIVADIFFPSIQATTQLCVSLILTRFNELHPPLVNMYMNLVKGEPSDELLSVPRELSRKASHLMKISQGESNGLQFVVGLSQRSINSVIPGFGELIRHSCVKRPRLNTV